MNVISGHLLSDRIAMQIAGELCRLRRPLHLRIVRKRANFPFVLVAQPGIHARPVLLELLDALSIWEGDNVVALLQQPGQVKLANGAFVVVNERLDQGYNLFVGIPIRVLKARHCRKENQIILSGSDTHAEPTLIGNHSRITMG